MIYIINKNAKMILSVDDTNILVIEDNKGYFQDNIRHFKLLIPCL